MIQFDTPAVVPADPDANVTDLLVQRVAATPDSVLFSLPTADGGWSPVTTKQFHDQVVALAKGLVAAGIQPGDKIGLMCKTRYEWTLVGRREMRDGSPVYRFDIRLQGEGETVFLDV